MCICTRAYKSNYMCVCVRRCVSLRLSLAPLSTQSFSMSKCATICKYLFIAKYLLCFLCLQTHR